MSDPVEDARSKVKQMLDQIDPVDMRAIAHKVLGDMTPAGRQALLIHLAPSWVADIARSMRSDGNVMATARAAAPPRRSAKIGQRADWYASLMREVYPTADGHKRLGEMTVEQVESYAAQLREQADRLHDRSDGFDSLARIMRETGAATVRAVEPEALREILKPAA